MKQPLTSLAAAGLALTMVTPEPVSAQGYQVDCAILLCLAGGWPASAPCAHARAVFIRRITPWPVEPPLQIWRCPMGASFDAPAPLSPMERVHYVTFRAVPEITVPDTTIPFVLAQADERADIDISGSAFDFLRSIRVYHIQFSQSETPDGDCIRYDSTRLGSYGVQGDYHWQPSSVAAVPPASLLPGPDRCDRVSYRSVFVDWRDHEGNYGFEEVRY